MKKDLPLKDFTYKDNNYEFKFVNPREAFHRSLVVRPKHLKVLRNDTEMSTKELKEFIVNEWFNEENESIKLKKKIKRDAKNCINL